MQDRYKLIISAGELKKWIDTENFSSQLYNLFKQLFIFETYLHNIFTLLFKWFNVTHEPHKACLCSTLCPTNSFVYKSNKTSHFTPLTVTTYFLSLSVPLSFSHPISISASLSISNSLFLSTQSSKFFVILAYTLLPVHITFCVCLIILSSFPLSNCQHLPLTYSQF